MTTAAANHMATVANARDIPAQTHKEAGELARVEFERLMATVDAIPDDCWENPTDCTLWDVRQMVAHLGGACAGYTSVRQFGRQYIFNPFYLRRMPLIDALNGIQVADRDDRTPADLIEEFRKEGPRATRVRQGIPWLVRKIYLPLGPLGLAPIGYLTDTIYTRDWWMHRADLCRATGQHMHLTPEHDGRVIGLVLRDLADELTRKKPLTETVDLHLVDDIEIIYRFGDKPVADATVTINLIEFNRLASGRISIEDATTAAEFSGNTAAARTFLENCEVPY